MPEIKHVFTGGKMNKDLDERFVPNGQYRDAMNIQVRTSDGGDSGVVQNLAGNTHIQDVDGALTFSGAHGYAEFVGQAADEANNKSYWLLAGSDVAGLGPESWAFPVVLFHTFADSIYEYNADHNRVSLVFNDVYAVAVRDSALYTPTGSFVTITVTSDVADRLRKGCRVQCWDDSGVALFDIPPTVLQVVGDVLHLDAQYSDDVSSADNWAFWWEPVLELKQNRQVTGINIIDDFLFFTDGFNEPKKISISRSKAGSSTHESFGNIYHTVLKVPNGSNHLASIDSLEPTASKYVEKEHITVIKQAPKTAPRLEMSQSTRGVDLLTGNITQAFSVGGVAIDQEIINIQIDPPGANIEVGDYLVLTQTYSDSYTFELKEIRLGVTNTDNLAAGFIDAIPQSVPSDILDSNVDWVWVLEDKRPMYELEFGRFAYRYKYADGEYSTFSPWSEVAFLPGKFDYEPQTGYNTGMTNTVREIKVTHFVANDETRPNDVDTIDILYKKTTDNGVYVVKSIQRDKDPEWDIQSNNVHQTQGEVVITSEMVHRVLPSSQLLRSWDAVPRSAFAQEITGSRLVYGNYKQNYDIPRFSSSQWISSESVKHGGNAEKSIKSIRSYRVGVVFGDKYGRETPVQEIGAIGKYTPSTGTYSYLSSDLRCEKQNSHTKNALHIQQKWETPQGQAVVPPSWMDYCKYYVKETSNEYYNLVMDRWYDAEDGNVWLSFQSSDRNKVDEETHITLKNQNGGSAPVHEEARYKILAISNSAPPFIKREGFTIGSVGFTQGITASSEFPLFTSITHDTAEYDAQLGMMNVSDGVRYARVVGTDDEGHIHKSAWKRVVGIDSGEVLTKVILIEALGPGADMDAIWLQNNYGTTVAYTVEYKVEDTIDKTEFDGRFFIKVLRDATLNEQVLHTTEDGMFWSTLDHFDVAWMAMGDYVWGSWIAEDNGEAWWSGHGSYSVAHSNPQVAGPYNTYKANTTDTWFDNVLGEMEWDSDIDDNDHIQGIGTCDNRGATHDFWTAHAAHKPSSWWIDNMRFAHGGSLLSANEGEYWNGDPTVASPEAAPNGLYASGSVGGDKDVLFFSRENTDSSDATTALQNVFQTEGTFFRFQNDPFQNVYRVINSSPMTTLHNYDDGSNCNMYNQTSGDNTSWTSLRRKTFWTQFRRVDAVTGGTTPSAIDTSVWDPRGEVKHTGENTMRIEIVTPFSQQGGKVKHFKEAAMWETEPKESVDIDIYYEATDAIPLTLDENNIMDYAPSGSVCSELKRGNEVHSLTPKAIVTDHKYGNIQFKETQSSTVLVPNGVLYRSFIVGDQLKLTHQNGLETNLVIKDHIYQNGDQTPVTSTSVVDTNATIPGPFMSDTQTVIFSDIGTINAVQSMHANGWRILVTGLNVPIGTFIALNNDQTSTLAADGNGLGITLTKAYEGSTVGTQIQQSFTFKAVTGMYEVEEDVYELPIKLPWYNCYSFGNGVESDRIRDDFNAPQLDNGCKASTVLDDYGEEIRGSGMIYSGLFNSNSSVNNLNEFNTSQKITKDLNPTYGSIQALKSRDTNVVAFCEDKVLKVLSNKDAVFNADGNPNLTATDRVLGQAIPFVGDYGISKNPESLASDQYRMYFADKQRGAILRLSNDGITPISNVGMKDWFRDNLAKSDRILGTFDVVKGEYNVTLNPVDNVFNLTPTTVSFNEAGKGWVSFKSFIPSAGGSVSGKYVTAANAGSGAYGVGQHLWLHDELGPFGAVNSFYGDVNFVASHVEVIFNDNPSTVKTFMALNYEGTQQKILNTTAKTASVTDAAGNSISANDGNHVGLTAQNGWEVTSITTDMQSGSVPRFVKKENKYFSYIYGDGVDVESFCVQGIGEAASVSGDTTNNNQVLTITG